MPQFMETNPNLIQEPTFSDQNWSEQWISEGGNSSGNNFLFEMCEVVSATISSFRDPLLASILVWECGFLYKIRVSLHELWHSMAARFYLLNVNDNVDALIF